MYHKILRSTLSLSIILFLLSCTESEFPNSDAVEMAGTTWEVALVYTTLHGSDDETYRQNGTLDITFNADGTMDFHETSWKMKYYKSDGTIQESELSKEDLDEGGKGIGTWVVNNRNINFNFGESELGNWQYSGIINKNRMSGEYTHNWSIERTWTGMKY